MGYGLSTGALKAVCNITFRLCVEGVQETQEDFMFRCMSCAAKIFHMHMQINMKRCLSQGFGIQVTQLESSLKFLSTLGDAIPVSWIGD